MITPQTFIATINQLLPEPHAGLLSGILFGHSAKLPKDFYETLRITGTLHMIALSGTNIVILIRVFGTVFMPFGRRLSSLLNILWIGVFVWFVGPSPSVVRAALMGGLSLIAVYAGRPYYGVLALAFTVALVGLVKPEWYGDIGFQLSVLASLGIMLSDKVNISSMFSDTLKPKKTASGLPIFRQQLVSILGADLKATIFAQLFTFPVILLVFHQLSLVSPLTNLLVGWVVAPIMVLGIILLLTSLIYLPLAHLLAWIVWALLEYFIVMVEVTARLPFARITF